MLIAPIQVKPHGTVEAFDGVLVNDHGEPSFGERANRWAVAGMGGVAYPGNSGITLIRAQIMNVALSDNEIVAVIVRGELDGTRFFMDRTGDAIAVQLPIESLQVVSNTVKARNRKIERITIHSGAVAITVDPFVEFAGGGQNTKVRDRHALANRLVGHILAVNEEQARATAVDSETLGGAGWMEDGPTELEHYVDIRAYYRGLEEDGAVVRIPQGSILGQVDDQSADSPSSQVQPPAGWYPDKRNSSRLRWWDGDTWTEHTTAPGRG